MLLKNSAPSQNRFPQSQTVVWVNRTALAVQLMFSSVHLSDCVVKTRDGFRANHWRGKNTHRQIRARVVDLHHPTQYLRGGSQVGQQVCSQTKLAQDLFT